MGRTLVMAAAFAAVALVSGAGAQDATPRALPQREIVARPMESSTTREPSARALATQAAPQARGEASTRSFERRSAVPHAPPGAEPFSQGGGQMMTVNGRSMPRDLVFRFLPVTLPMSTVRVSSLFGLRTHPIHGFSRHHSGVDFAAPTGTPAHTTAAGVVVSAGWSGDYGNMVEVRHALEFTTRYGHLSEIWVVPGQTLDRHEQIGAVGSTGRSTGPHLHFEIRHQNRPIDPIRFILLAYEAYRHIQ